MRTLLAALAAFFVIWPTPCLAWGPITHLEIAEMQGGTSHDYRAGCLLPDFSLAYRTGYDKTYPNLQSVTHSQAFRDALAEVASDDFMAGWDSHLYADTIESPYSQAKVKAGAPCGADYVVDQAYDQEDNCPEMQSGYISDRYVKWINYALDKVGCETDYPSKNDVGYAYRAYLSGMYQPNKRYYKQVLDEWYSDYQEYVDKAANVQSPPEPPSPPTPPGPTPPDIVSRYYQYSYLIMFSHTQVMVGEPFSVTVTADIECIRDLPIGVRTIEAAFDFITGDEVLVSDYQITVTNFPDWAGDTAHVSVTADMALSTVGTHTISARLTAASVDGMDITHMIPDEFTSIPIGIVVCARAPEPNPAPKIANRTPRPWYSYEAPPEREEAERLKAEKWAEIDQAMRATDDIAEKLRLYAEWEIFRDRHNTPSVRT